MRYHLFVGLNEVASDGKSGEYYWNGKPKSSLGAVRSAVLRTLGE